jgi:hypothetical protein
MITNQISNAGSVVELEDVYNEWSGSFNFIHAAAAFVKCSKLPGGARSPLAGKLSTAWLGQLPLANTQSCVNVLWASTRLGSPTRLPKVWSPTWTVFIERMQQRRKHENPQHVANALWACAKLQQQPSADELQLLVQTFLQQDVLASAIAQAIVNCAWAVGKLCQLPGWQGGVSEQDVQQLLGKEQLQLVACSPKEQASSNLLLALAAMSTGEAPVVSHTFAKQTAVQLLAMAGSNLINSTPQGITNAMWACSELELAGELFLSAAVAAAPTWVPNCASQEISQAATACVKTQYRDEAFMQLLLQHAMQLMQHQQHGKRGATPPSGRSPVLSGEYRAVLASLCSTAVAKLDMQQLAGTAKQLVVVSGVGSLLQARPAKLGRLWVFHCWLLQHQLLDGKGLTGVLTQQQLQQGKQKAAQHGFELEMEGSL